MKYKKGDRVRIVSDRTKNMNSNGNMDKYLGTVMTIKEAHKTGVFGISYHYRMVEDKCEWFWNDEMIAGLASEIPFDFGAWKDKNVCMHCKTEKEAEDFCREMNKAGLRWSSGTSYLKISCFSNYENYTCYYFNEGRYDNTVHAKDKGYTILEWSDYRSTEPKEEQEKTMEPKADDKPLSFTEAMKIKLEMCRSYMICANCPLNSVNNGLPGGCVIAFAQNPKKSEKILKEWLAEHPVKTNMDKLIEVFGEIQKYDDKCKNHCSAIPCKGCNWWQQEYIEPYEEKE